MIYSAPSSSFEATLDGAPTGLTGTLGVQILDTPGNNVVLGRTTGGISEAPTGSGIYSVALAAPATQGTYSVVWDTGGGTPVYASEDLVVTSTAPVVVAPVAPPPAPPGGLTLTPLIARLNTFAGLDLSTAEATDLLNEAQRELARRSEYPRKTVTSVGPTVAEQEAYTLPSDFLFAKELVVGTTPWTASYQERVDEMRAGWQISWDSVWWIATDSAGAETLHLYPTPSTPGTTIRLNYVYRPVDLVGTASPDWLPVDFHPALCSYAASVAFKTIEDNADFAQVHMQDFEQAIINLRRYRNKRASPGAFRIPVIV